YREQAFFKPTVVDFEALLTLTTASMDIVYRDMVKTSFRNSTTTNHGSSRCCQESMLILDKSDFANLRSENAKMKTELEQIKNRLLKAKKIRADAKLHFNLERSRFTEQEKKLMEVRTEFRKMVRFTNKKTQVASLKTLLESLKLEKIRYLAGMYSRCFSDR
uniref:Coiled-coil domain containing 90B n=1 Tax=Cyprinus carpio TaxID=7962 RepID=A0A8C2IBB2_CYPCA